MKLVLATVISCILIGIAYSQTWNKNHCGKRPLVEPRDDKVVGGSSSTAGDWPWSCSMLINGRHGCGGSLINGQWIVTAAHCVGSTTSMAAYEFICGLHSRLTPETYARRFKPIRAVVHSAYSSSTIRNDIALFQISSTDIAFTNYIMPVCFPPLNQNYAGQESIGMGWGTLSSGGALATVHMEVKMPVLTDARCRSKMGTNLDPATQICAGETGQSKDTCQGDSGGPLVVKHSNGLWYLAGITSWGRGCGDGGAYTRSSAFRNWVMGYVQTLPSGSG